MGESVLDSNVRKTTWVKDVRYWCGVRNWRLPLKFNQVLVDALIDLKLDNKVIGMEFGAHHISQVGIDEIRLLESSLPNARFVSAEKVLWEQKMIKTDWEIALMREMCAKTNRVLGKAWQAIRPGLTERDIHRIVWQEWINEDMFENALHVQPGPVSLRFGRPGQMADRHPALLRPGHQGRRPGLLGLRSFVQRLLDRCAKMFLRR